MILYVNGDSHSAGSEAVNTYSFAVDDPIYWALGRKPHPDNLRVSYGCELANMMYAVLECDAESASSNDRIVRTTYEYLTGGQDLVDYKKPDLIVIGWTTWEREEWWHYETDRYWQINGGGVGHDWPEEFKLRYKQFVADINFNRSMQQAQDKIWALHKDLQTMGIDHVFFNSFEQLSNVDVLDWEGSYIEPYNPNYAYYNWLKARGFDTVRPDSYHFGPDAHRAWAEFLYQNIAQKNLTS